MAGTEKITVEKVLKKHLFLNMMIDWIKHSIILFSGFISLMANGQEPEPYFREKIAFPVNHYYIKSASLNGSATAGETDIFYQRMEWEVDPAVKYISGKITSWFRVITPGTGKIAFNMTDSLKVDSVLWRNKKSEFTHSGDLVTIPFGSILKEDTKDSVSVWYHGQPGNSGMGSFVCSKHNSVPILWTLSEPYSAMEWWPCKQSLADKIDSIDIIVTTPAKYKTASNGLVVSDRVVNVKRIMHWKHRYPIVTYLIAIAVTNYSEYTDTVRLNDGTIFPVLNYVYPESLSDARYHTPVALSAIRLYSDIFGRYPFSREKYGHAQFGWGGGMEHQTMSFVTNFGFGLLVHELSHSWFGNCITLSSWHDIWLNEGFATYAEGLAYERLKGNIAWKQWLRNNLNYILNAVDGSVYVADTSSINRLFSGRLSYSKGAYLLHMLRWKMGDSLFFKTLQNYFSDSRLRYGFASQQQWINHLESASGISYTEFFNDWYYGEGYPVYSAIFRNMDANKLQIQLSQTSSHPSVPFFEVPVPVRAYSAGKKDSVDLRLDHRVNNQVFEMNVPFSVSEIVVDPDFWLIRKVDKVTRLEDRSIAPPGLCIFPNPSNGNWQVMTGNGEIPLNYGIFDLSGRLLLQQKMNGNVISAPWLLPGIYILKTTTGKGIFETKLVKR